MSALDDLAGYAGRWQGTNRLHDPTTNAPEDSPSTAHLTGILGGKFVRMGYTWAYQGSPQEGSLLFGYESGAAAVTAHWIDTWHMGEGVMSCRGTADPDGSIQVKGSYAAPSGPDWGWRIVLRPEEGRALHLVMYNIPPESDEQVAVEADYTRI